MGVDIPQCAGLVSAWGVCVTACFRGRQPAGKRMERRWRGGCNQPEVVNRKLAPQSLLTIETTLHLHTNVILPVLLFQTRTENLKALTKNQMVTIFLEYLHIGNTWAGGSVMTVKCHDHER